jgi:lipoprotein-anchoring transpeptidase ErfK/SrfK
MEYLEIKYPTFIFDNFIYVGVKRQKIYIIKNNQVFLSYNVSTSKHGAGIINNSNMTPVGLHKIRNKIGDDIPENGIFKYRKYTGEIAEIENRPIKTGLDIISSRIITIEGLEPGLNKGKNIDSYERNIYIHGTNEEGLIGKPASHGCIRMKNQEIITLYKHINADQLIVILNN